eukprot:m.654009 g.654009  ORF g.654009 m.654009 type:complete len:649 (-) comp22691_c2_seq59:321-2267(-)
MLINTTDVTMWARIQIQRSYATLRPGQLILSSEQDEPSWYWPDAYPPINTSAVVRARWVDYLKSTGLSAGDFGHASWDDVAPIGRNTAGAGTNHTSPLTKRKLYYWSMRFSHWDAVRYYRECTAAFQAEFNDPTLALYANFNNFDGRMFVPGQPLRSTPPNATELGWMSFDWFEWARMRGANLLWTEDWFSDEDAHRWSYYASKLRSAISLAAGDDGSMEFGGYIVPRTSGSSPGGMLKRILTLVGSGSKSLKYFTFGPEYTFPTNCYSEKVEDAPTVFQEMQLGHHIIAKAEHVLWEARKPQARIAILAPRSSNFWDLWDEENPKQLCMCCCVSDMIRHYMDYSTEMYGLYVALATDLNLPVDFVDEDALQNKTVLHPYSLLLVTQPNIPIAGFKGLIEWVQDGGVLALSSGAATADAYNDPVDLVENVTGVRTDARPRVAFTAFPTTPVARGTWHATPSPPLPTGASGKAEPAGTPTAFSAFGAVSTLSAPLPPSATVNASFADGSPAAVTTRVGRGSLVHFLWLPGLSYVQANRTDDARIPLAALAHLATTTKNPRVYAAVDVPRIETPILLSPDGKSAVVTIVDFRDTTIAKAASGIQITACVGFAVSTVESSVHGPLPFQRRKAGCIVVQYTSLLHGDMIVLM